MSKQLHSSSGIFDLDERLTSVGRRFFSVSLDLHSTGDSSVGFSAGEIGNVDEGVVESCQDVADSELVLVLLASSNDGGTVVSNLFSGFFTFSAFGGGLSSFLLCL